ncbi:MAG: proteasome subunit alpha [Nitrospinota bacterium]|nr:MAG: proteasome subunit alpha [Nitrospinota bacterium]
MAMPFYVAPDQMVQDKAEYAKKGIAKGKSIVVLEYKDGIILTAENPSASLNKIAEIYDRIAFAGVGKYSEFENLRKAGVRYADIKGYAYSREDVTTKSLANAYSEVIGNIFTREIKPLEVEILVTEVGEDPQQNQIYHISFDGSISDHHRYAVIGGQAEKISSYLERHYQENLELPAALALCKAALETVQSGNSLPEENLEVAILDRNREGRKFRRIPTSEIGELLRQARKG